MLWHEKVVVFALMVAAVYVLFWLPFGRREYRGPEARDGEPAFVGGRAWDDVQTLAVRFPRRWSGSAGRRAAADWLDGVLKEIGLEVHRETFPAALGQSEPVLLENVWGVSRGSERPDEIVVALGNYDMAPTSFQAASDTAGRVGTILELARVIHASPHRRTFVFFFPDGEEWGMLGARHFVRTFAERKRIVAALSIEDLDPGRFRALGIDGIGQSPGTRRCGCEASPPMRPHGKDVPPMTFLHCSNGCNGRWLSPRQTRGRSWGRGSRRSISPAGLLIPDPEGCRVPHAVRYHRKNAPGRGAGLWAHLGTDHQGYRLDG